MSAEGAPRHRLVSWLVPLLIGVIGVGAAGALPFAPVWTPQSTLIWPAPGSPAVSSTAFLAPYRPMRLTATVPCAALRAGAARATATTVLSTASAGQGLLVRVADGSAQVLLNAHLVDSVSLSDPLCGLDIDAGPTRTTIASADTMIVTAGPPPAVQFLRTDLTPDQATGLDLTARTASVFEARAGGVKKVLIALWAVAAALALGWLWLRGRSRDRNTDTHTHTDIGEAADSLTETAAALTAEHELNQSNGGADVVGPRRSWAAAVVDVGVVAVLGVWAVIGPLADDDGFVAMIARNSRAAGYEGNFYRWWNASEAPFALTQHLLTPLTQLSLSPLWLRVPSTVLAVGTWLFLVRGVLPVALPGFSGRWGIRLAAAACFLACWLPFNLGVRPEAYVAFGLTAVVALLWRARTVWALGAAALIAGVSMTASPSAIMLLAPVLVFAPKIVRILTAGTARRRDIAARVSVLCCLGAVALVVVFADQSWHTVAVATVWHTRFGPSLPWYDEFARYRYLLGADQDGTATKRLPVLLALTLLPIIGLGLARTSEPTPTTRTHPTPADTAHTDSAHAAYRAAPEPVPTPARPMGSTTGAGGADLISPGAARLAALVSLGLGLLWWAPSKWTHYFGALAGVFAAFLVVAIVLLARCARRPAVVHTAHPQQVVAPVQGRGADDPVLAWVGLCGSGIVAVAIGLAFSGPNAWWQPAVYDVPWAGSAITPAGVPLNSPLLWAAIVAVGVAVIGHRHGTEAVRRALIAGPAVLALTAAGVSVAVLLGSFITAPLRQPSGSLARSNIHRLTGHPTCGLGDDVQVLPDVAGSVMAPTSGDPGQVSGFIAGAGYDPSAPPPERPGTGTSTQLWGSLGVGPTGAVNTATLSSPWFRLPAVAPDQEVTVSVAGRTTAGNMLALEFGHAEPDGAVTSLGRRTPPDPLRAEPGESPQYRLWRSVGVAAGQVPIGSDRVRIDAVDASADPDGWLAVTGPRLRHVVPLSRYLAEHSPVLVAWPIAFLFPCATNPVAVHDGFAQAPVSVLEAPQQYSGLGAATTDPTIGGDYAPLREVGGLGEVTTRIAGRPNLDWGDLLATNYPAARDTYSVTTTWVKVSGLRSDDTPPPPPVRASIP